MNVILYAIPLFFTLIALEWFIDWRKGTAYLRLNDAIGSLSAGIVSRVMDIVHKLIPLSLYVLVYENYGLFTLPENTVVWVIAFIAYDFFYYWNHRLGHELSVLWAAHVVHHSSEEYNLTTALRQTSGSVFSWIFYLPLAVVGVPPLILLTVGALNLVYQFWVHTRHIGRLGWFEWVFVTPSNHRVHHAQNRVYIDRNYGGVFIIWDRLFGSFQDELDSEPPVYGIRGALKTFNPIGANCQVYSQLIRDSWHTKRWADKWRVWFGRTGWRPLDVTRAFPIEKKPLSEFKKYDPKLSCIMKRYCFVQHVALLGFTLFLLLEFSHLTPIEQLFFAVMIVFASVTNAMLLDISKFALWVDLARQFGLTVGLLFLGLPNALVVSMFLVMLASLLTASLNKHLYTQETVPTPIEE